MINNACYAVYKNSGVCSGEDSVLMVTVTSRIKDNEIQIIIQDNGIDITRDMLPKICQPLYTAKPAGVGTGLGLSIIMISVLTNIMGR